MWDGLDASAIRGPAGLAKGEEMEIAVPNAKAWVSAAIAAADRFSVGHGHGPVHHFHQYY